MKKGGVTSCVYASPHHRVVSLTTWAVARRTSRKICAVRFRKHIVFTSTQFNNVSARPDYVLSCSRTLTTVVRLWYISLGRFGGERDHASHVRFTRSRAPGHARLSHTHSAHDPFPLHSEPDHFGCVSLEGQKWEKISYSCRSRLLSMVLRASVMLYSDEVRLRDT